MQRHCVCGKRISWRQSLCDECISKHGRNRDAWPDWLSKWVKDTQSEIDANRRHDEGELYDENPPPDVVVRDRVGTAWSCITETMSIEGARVTGDGHASQSFVAASSDDVEAEVIARETVHEIARRLTPRQALVLGLAAEGRSQPEIGLQLGCTQQAVSKQLQRAYAVVADCMGPQAVYRPRVQRTRPPADRAPGLYVERLLRDAPYEDEGLNRAYRHASGIRRRKR